MSDQATRNHYGDFDTEYTDEPVCPVCGCKQQDLFEYSDVLDDGEHEMDCQNCSTQLLIETVVTTYFTTHKRGEA